RVVAGAWLLITLVGIATVGHSINSFSKKFGVPGREGYPTNSKILGIYHQGGRYAPLVPVVKLPAGTAATSPSVHAGLDEVTARLERALPGTRIASFASTGNRAFVSANGRTTFMLAYPPPSDGSFGDNTKAAKRAAEALAGAQVAGAPVHLTGLDALQSQNGGGDGPGVFREALIGGAGALAVLAFVFASLLALVPIVIAIVSIMTTFLILGGLTNIASVSEIVEFLVALIGLGVA